MHTVTDGVYLWVWVEQPILSGTEVAMVGIKAGLQ